MASTPINPRLMSPRTDQVSLHLTGHRVVIEVIGCQTVSSRRVVLPNHFHSRPSARFGTCINTSSGSAAIGVRDRGVRHVTPRP